MAASFSFKQTPDAAKAYLKGKGFKLSFNYDEMTGTAHHNAFTVAKITRTDLLNDVFTSLNQAMESGETFKDWQARIKPTLQKKGWWGEQRIIDKRTGEYKDIYIGSRRLHTIFNTNMRVAHSVARYGQMKALTTAVFWRYVSMLLPKTRDAHSEIHGTVLPKDDAFWNTNYPPNDWGCKCKVRAYSAKQLEKRGLKVSDNAPKSVAGKDWNHDVGAGSKVGALSQMKLGTGLTTLLPNQALDNLDDNQIKDRFYQTLGIKKGGLYIDKIGDPMTIDDELFTTARGGSKAKKRKRHLYIDELAQTITDPDEIYLEVEKRTGKAKLVKKMFRYFKDENGDNKAFMALFTYEKNKTMGTSIYVVDRADVVAQKRVEKLIYKKKK